MPFPSLEDLPDLGTEPGSPPLLADHLLSEPPGNLTGLYPTECECYCVQSLSHIQLFGTAKSCKWTAASQLPLSMGFFRQESWSGLPFPTPGDLPDPAIEPLVSWSLALAGGYFTTVPPGK